MGVETISNGMIIVSVVILDKYGLLTCLVTSMLMNSSDNIQVNNSISDNSIDAIMQTLYDTMELKSNDNNRGIIDNRENFIAYHVHAVKGTINDSILC